MKRISLLFISVVLISAVEAKEKKEPVVMTVAGKDVPLSEFLYAAKKEDSIDFKNKKAVENYVELYKNFKLKVADAEARFIHTNPRFDYELEQDTRALQSGYFTDKKGEDSAMYVIYNRTKVVPNVKEIYFSYPPELRNIGQVLTKDTVELFLKADAAYQRIKNGESFEDVGESLKDGISVQYAVFENVVPFQFPNVLEEAIFAMNVGEISAPVRSTFGFHLFKIDRKVPSPGRIRVAHIILAFPSNNPTDEEIEETRSKSEGIYQKALIEEDFSKIVLEYSDDSIGAKKGGMLEFGLGEFLKPIERAAFALENIGDISKPVQSQYGFHILKLVERLPDLSFEEKQSYIFDNMRISERVFDLYHGFVEKMKPRHGYVFYPEAYEELKRLADEYHPEGKDSVFVTRGLEMDKLLLHIDLYDFLQSDFVEYIYRNKQTNKFYSLDYMQDNFQFFVREILIEIEKSYLERDYPEYTMQVKQLYDGNLLFEISNSRIWSRPEEEQARFEAEWIKELNEKYPVKINWRVIRKIKKV